MKKTGKFKKFIAKLLKLDSIVNLYMVVDKEDANKIYTIVATEKDVVEYIDTMLYIMNYPHFKMWCDNQFKQECEESWREYKSSMELDATEPFSVLKMTLDTQHVAAIYRTIQDCVPVGCSYETDAEINRFLEKLSPEDRVDVEKIFTTDNGNYDDIDSNLTDIEDKIYKA